MDFIKEITAFERWLETNYLPGSVQLLWYKLFMLNNRAGWCEWVQVDNQRLMAMMHMESKNTFLRARDRLVEAKLVSFVKGKKGYPNKYKLYPPSSCGSYFEPQMAPQTAPQTALQTAPQTGHISKQRQRLKQEKDILTDIQRETEWAAFVEMRKSIKKPLTGRAAEMALSKLEKLAPDDIGTQKQILDQSTYHCWQGLFALKGERDERVRESEKPPALSGITRL